MATIMLVEIGDSKPKTQQVAIKARYTFNLTKIPLTDFGYCLGQGLR
jgi:hypothetical protein